MMPKWVVEYHDNDPGARVYDGSSMPFWTGVKGQYAHLLPTVPGNSIKVLKATNITGDATTSDDHMPSSLAAC